MGITITNSGQGSVVRFRNLGRGGVMTSTKLPSFLLLDTYSGAAAAYSLRKLSYTYTGAAIRVRRSSDNAETNIGFVNNNLDTVSLLAFCGAGSGFVTVWYDQSGNARNAVQETTTNQPTIVSLGVLQVVNDKASIKFISSSFTRLTLSGILSGNQQRTQIAVYRPTVTSGVLGVFGQGTDPNIGKWSYIQARSGVAAGDPYFAGYNADLGNGLSVMNTDAKIGTFLYNGSTGYLWKNNTQLASGSLVLNTSGSEVVQIGMSGRSGFFEPMEGFINECILYASNQLSNISGINSNINSYYSIYTPTWQGNGTALLDLYPNAAAAYSLRNLSSTYTGPLVRVRRSSDNTEQDIYGTLAGVLDTTALTTFCGVGNGFIVRWYDQSGNGRDVLGSTSGTALQPKIVTSGVIETINSKPAILANGIDQMLINQGITNQYAVPVLHSMFAVANKGVQTTNAATTPRPIFAGIDGITNGISYLGTAYSGSANQNKYYVGIIGGGTIINSVDWNDGNTILAYNKMTGGSGAVVGINGNSTTGSLVNITTATNYIGIFGNFGEPPRRFSGKIPELILYASDQTSNRTAIETNINSYYSIYTAPTVVTTGLVLSLDAGNVASYPGSGTTWTDTVQSKTFTLYGSPTYNSANGGYLTFDPASSQYAESSTSLTSSLGSYTIEAWHYYTGGNTGGNPCIVTEVFPGSTSKINYSLGFNTTTTGVQSGFYDGTWRSTPAQILTTNTWNHIVGTYDGTTVKLYVNNSLAQSSAVTAIPVSSQGGIRLMRRWDSGDYWKGNLAIVRMYTGSLDSTQIAQNFNAQRSRFGL